MKPVDPSTHGTHSEPDHRLLLHACRALHRCTDPTAVAQVLVAHCISAGADRAAVYLAHSSEANTLVLSFWHGEAEHFPAQVRWHDARQTPNGGTAHVDWSDAWITQPLGERDYVIGLLAMQWEADRTVPPAWRSTLSQLAVDATDVLRRLAATNGNVPPQPLMQALQSISAISYLGLLPAQPIERLVQALLQQLLDALPLAAAAIWLSDETTRQLLLPSIATKRTDPYNAVTATLWTAPSITAMRHIAQVCFDGKSHVQVVNADMSEYPGVSQGLRKVQAARVINFALQIAGRSIGVLQLLPAQHLDNIEALLGFARVLSQQIAVAIENARILVHTRANQERISAVVDATNDAILMLDEHQRVMIINRRARFFFGLSEHELIGKDYEQFSAIFGRIFQEGREFNNWLSHLLQSEREREVEEFHTLGNDPRLLQCFSAPVIDRHNRLLGRLLVFRDITREREVERMKSEFVSTVSHELRTPLSSIQGALQLVLGNPQLNRAGIADQLPPRAQSLLTISLNNTARLIRLINDILDIAKIEQGRIELQRDAISPFELCQSACDEVAGLSSERDVHIHLQVNKDIPSVFADRDRIVQVLVNLLSNAIKFSYPGQPVEVTAQAEGSHICFSVCDQGRGIAEEDQGRLFQKFQQVDSSSTRDTGGTGLGLAISKALVEEHGGRIWLQSTPQKGSTFFFTLPIARDHSIQPRIVRRVLLCVPQEDRRTTLSEALQPIGSVIVLAEPARLEQRLHELQPDLIVVSDGADANESVALLRRVRNEARHHGIPLVILSDHLEPYAEAPVLPHNSSVDVIVGAVQQALAVHRPLVLIVDDDPHVRPVLARLLQRHGMRVRQAVDGYEGLEIAAQLHPEVILLDVLMPGIDGYEVLRRLRDDPSTSDIPVIILSANDPRDRAPKAVQQLAIADYLEKPISAERLTTAIHRVIAGNRHG